MLLQQASCVFFHNGVESFVCAGDSVQWVQWRRTAVLCYGVIAEYFEEDFRRQGLYIGHVEGLFAGLRWLEMLRGCDEVSERGS